MMIESVLCRASEMKGEARARYLFFFFSSRRRHTRFDCDWSSDVCSSDLQDIEPIYTLLGPLAPARRAIVIRNDPNLVPSQDIDLAPPQCTAHQSLQKIAEIGRASCREECRSRWSPYH